MAGMVENLYKALEDQLQCYEALNVLAKQTQACLVDKNLENLKYVVKREEEFTGRVLLLDKQTKGVTRDLALVLGIRNKDFKLKEVIERCEDNEREVLEALRVKILKNLDSLKKQNQLNKELIERSLELVDFTMTALHSHKESQPIGYEYMGETQTRETTNYFDKKQ